MQNTPGQQYPSPAGMPPTLGQQTPGMNSEMPAAGGLSALANPMAKQLQSMGRGDDTMLIHMTPEEVGGLQQLALATGGSLTINPHTGLPEAGWLKKLLPTILGAVLAPFTGGLSAALLVGTGYTAATGSLQKGLMAGLGAFGGAGIGNAVANIGAKAASGVAGASAAQAAGTAAKGAFPGAEFLGSNAAQAAGTAAKGAFPGAEFLGSSAAQAAGQAGTQVAGEAVKQGIGQTAKSALSNVGTGLKTIGTQAMQNPLAAGKTFAGEFANATREGLTPGSMMYKYAPTAATMGVMGNVSDAMQPQMEDLSLPEEKSTYEGPYVPAFRQVQYGNLTGDPSRDSGEQLYFNPVNPVPSYVPAKAMSIKDKDKGYAEGGSASSKTSGLEALIARYASKNPGAVKASVNPTPRTKAPAATESTSSTPSSTSMSSAPFVQTVVPGGGGAPVKTDTTVNPEVLRGRYGVYTPEGGWGVNAMAGGGHINMGDGSFVVDARTVSELGNGSSNAGIELLRRMGGKPVKGPGDGVSDSVPASIGGKQAARVARDEVIFPPQAVNRMGGGSNKRGADKLYAMMERAHKARKQADRGEDTKLRRGLA